MTKRELVAVLAMGVALFVGGYRYAAAIYGEDIAELREDYASRAQQLEEKYREKERATAQSLVCLLYTSPSPRDISGSRMPSSA